MGRELAAHLLGSGHDVVLWNRTPGAAAPFAAAGASVAASAAEAVAGAELVLTCLFGPDSVREVVLDAGLPIEPGAVWGDITTVGPFFAAESDAWAGAVGVPYVHCPVLGSLGPARNRDLGVLLGSRSAAAIEAVRPVVALWADPDRVLVYDDPAKAATGKLVVNYGLAVGLQAVVEALRVAMAGGLTLDEGLALTGLAKTPLSVISGMKGAAVRSGDFTNTQFSADLLAKDMHLALTVAEGQSLPCLTAAYAALEHARRLGHGDEDFSVIAQSLTRD
jgi:3-hydroxyisobutyrate dehydrogenase